MIPPSHDTRHHHPVCSPICIHCKAADDTAITTNQTAGIWKDTENQIIGIAVSTAYDVVNTYDADELKNIIYKYGEERWASRIADFVVKARKDKPIETTGQLVDIIKAAIPASARRDGPHPAKRTFQAIRIEVNDELGQLERAVDEFCDVLAPGGRLCIITFHSLEDRIVKDIINRRINPCTCPKEFPVCVCGKIGDIKKKSNKPIAPTAAEIERNPRARSAKLRIAEKK